MLVQSLSRVTPILLVANGDIIRWVRFIRKNKNEILYSWAKWNHVNWKELAIYHLNKICMQKYIAASSSSLELTKKHLFAVIVNVSCKIHWLFHSILLLFFWNQDFWCLNVHWARVNERNWDDHLWFLEWTHMYTEMHSETIINFHFKRS